MAFTISVVKGGALSKEGQDSAYTLRYGRWVMIAKLVNVFFGCRHSRLSFPVTVPRAKHRPEAAALTGTYVVCLDCGREFAYDWQHMKLIDSPERQGERVTELAKHAA